jgi:hypothetical protein
MSKLLFALALAAWTSTPDDVSPSTEHRQRYLIELRVYRGDPLGSPGDGTVKLLTQRSAITPAGYPVYFLAGHVRADSTGINGPGASTLVQGVGVEVLLLPGPFGFVRVGAESEWRDTADEKPAAKGQRVVRYVLPGQRVRTRVVATSPTDQTWTELTVHPVK